MADPRPSLIGFMPEREDQKRLVAKAQTEQLRPQRDPDTRDDIPEPRRVVRDADLPVVFSPMG